MDRNGTWSAQAANEYMTTILSEYTEANNNMVELVICNNDGMAEGAITALQDRRLQHRRRHKAIPVFGVDATDAAKAADRRRQHGRQHQAGRRRHGGGHLTLLAKNATSGAALMDGTDSYNVDDGSCQDPRPVRRLHRLNKTSITSKQQEERGCL